MNAAFISRATQAFNTARTAAVRSFNAERAAFTHGLTPATEPVVKVSVPAIRNALRTAKTPGEFKAIGQAAKTRQSQLANPNTKMYKNLEAFKTQAKEGFKASKKHEKAVAAAQAYAANARQLVSSETATAATSLFKRIGALFGGATVAGYIAGEQRPTLAEVLAPCNERLATPRPAVDCTIKLTTEKPLAEILKFDAPRPTSHPAFAMPRRKEISVAQKTAPTKTLAEVLKFDAPRPTSHPAFAMPRREETAEDRAFMKAVNGVTPVATPIKKQPEVYTLQPRTSHRWAEFLSGLTPQTV